MSTEPEKKTEAGKGSTQPNSGDIALQYVTDEYAAAKKSLRNSQIVSIVLVLVVLSYMSFITVMIRNFMEPQSAAEMVTGMIADKVSEHSTDLANKVKSEVPKRLAEAPDMLLQRLPEWRADLEDRVETLLTEQITEHSTQLGAHLDTLLEQHQADIGELLEHTGDKEKTKVLLTSIEQDILEFMEDELDGGESIKGKLQFTLDALQNIETQMDRLANGKNLTDQEKRTRRAIALITSKVDAARAHEPVKKDDAE